MSQTKQNVVSNSHPPLCVSNILVLRCGHDSGCIDGLGNRFSIFQLIYKESFSIKTFLVDAVTAESVLTAWKTVTLSYS